MKINDVLNREDARRAALAIVLRTSIDINALLNRMMLLGIGPDGIWGLRQVERKATRSVEFITVQSNKFLSEIDVDVTDTDRPNCPHGRS